MTLRQFHDSRFLALILVAGVALLSAVRHEAAQAQRQEGRIHVDVRLVSVFVSVTDAGGRPIGDLPREAFALSEEGVEQRIELFDAETQQPLDLALMIDTSLSALKELEFEKEAAVRFIRGVVRPGDGLSVFGFADQVDQHTAFISDLAQLEAGVKRITPGAGTSMYDAVFLGGRALGRRPAGRRRVIVLVTDAGETTSSASFDDARRSALASEAMLYTIIVDPIKADAGRNLAGEHALITITDATGGAMFTAEDTSQLDRIFQQINRELRTQYRLGYYPHPLPPPRSSRTIAVKVTTGAAGRGDPAGYQVRHRKVYFTDGERE